MNNIKVNDLTPDTKKTMKTRIITALILVGIVLPTLILGGWYFVTLTFVVLLWAIHEFINAPAHDRYNILVHVFIYIVTLGIVFWIFVKSNVNSVGWDLGDWKFENGLNHIEVSTISIAVTTCVLFMISLTNKSFNMNDVTYLFTMIVFIGLSSQGILFLRYFPSFAFQNNPLINYPEPTWWSTSFLIIYVLLGTFMADIGAYFTGVIFGRNKMNPRISPKKTWEGFAGGVALSIIVSLAFAFIADLSGYPLLPFMTLQEWYWVVCISVIMPFLSTLGDFIFSAIKRNFEIKDYGTIFPGMGGVLDRIDSLLVTSLVVAIIITFIHNGWSLLA